MPRRMRGAARIGQRCACAPPGCTYRQGNDRDAARACLRRVPLDRPLRLLGVRVGSLVSPEELLAGEDPFSGRVAGMLLPLEP